MASVSTGTPAGQVSRSRARRLSRELTRGTIATAAEPYSAVSASVRLPMTVPVPAASRSAAAWLSIRPMRSSTNSARNASKSAKCRCRTPLATPASSVTALLVSALGPARSMTRSAASNSWSRGSRRATPVGKTGRPSGPQAGQFVAEWAVAHYSGHMTTLPSEQVLVAPAEAHQARQVAESFGADPGRYDRTRPRYPEALVARIVAATPGPQILDV